MFYAKRHWKQIEECIYISQKKTGEPIYLVSKSTNYKLYRFANIDSLEEARKIRTLLEKEKYPSSHNLLRVGLAHTVWKKMNPTIRLSDNAFRRRLNRDWKKYRRQLPGRKEYYIHMDDIPKMHYEVVLLKDLEKSFVKG